MFPAELSVLTILSPNFELCFFTLLFFASTLLFCSHFTIYSQNKFQNILSTPLLRNVGLCSSISTTASWNVWNLFLKQTNIVIFNTMQENNMFFIYIMLYRILCYKVKSSLLYFHTHSILKILPWYKKSWYTNISGFQSHSDFLQT